MLRMKNRTNVKALGAEAALSVSTNTAMNLLINLTIQIEKPIRGNVFLLEDALVIALHQQKIKYYNSTDALNRPARETATAGHSTALMIKNAHTIETSRASSSWQSSSAVLSSPH